MNVLSAEEQARYDADRLKRLAASGGWIGFHHASVADRLREAEERRARAGVGTVVDGAAASAYVECVGMLHRYWVLKEVAWVAYFLSTGAVSALVGCAVFLVHPFWRRWYRKRWPKAGA